MTNNKICDIEYVLNEQNECIHCPNAICPETNNYFDVR